MTQTAFAVLGLVLAMAAPADSGANPWVQLIPFALVLAIFYFLILLPMQRKQKKVQQFIDALKVGDRVVTTSGIYGQITRISDKSVQLQIADKVRIEIAKAAVGGYQGQEPVAPDAAGQSVTLMDKNLRWRALAILAVVGLCPIWAHSTRPQKIKVRLGLDLQGGVHLVLRVQTDDALRLDTETTMEQLREAAGDQGAVTAVTFTGDEPTRFKVDGVPQAQDAAFREAANEVADALQP